jgi:hypothetical protein
VRADWGAQHPADPACRRSGGSSGSQCQMPKFLMFWFVIMLLLSHGGPCSDALGMPLCREEQRAGGAQPPPIFPLVELGWQQLPSRVSGPR